MNVSRMGTFLYHKGAGSSSYLPEIAPQNLLMANDPNKVTDPAARQEHKSRERVAAGGDQLAILNAQNLQESPAAISAGRRSSLVFAPALVRSIPGLSAAGRVE